jgi:ectoine hydroxylase-related dioxygenase (phytanoyl-CoA dioxygenase family)
VEWHADADAATIFRVAASAINVWMPLDAVGTDLPSLEIVPRSHTAMRRVAMLTGKDRHRDDAFVRTLGPSSIPQLQLGDALIFDQFTLHRTQNVGARQAVRKACEFRFVRRSAPTLHGLSGWVRYKWNNTFSADGALAAKAKSLLHSK